MPNKPTRRGPPRPVAPQERIGSDARRVEEDDEERLTPTETFMTTSKSGVRMRVEPGRGKHADHGWARVDEVTADLTRDRRRDKT